MDMTVEEGGSLWQRITSDKGRDAIVMNPDVSFPATIDLAALVR